MIDEKKLIEYLESEAAACDRLSIFFTEQCNTEKADNYSRQGKFLRTIIFGIQRGDFNAPAGNAQAVKDAWKDFDAFLVSTNAEETGPIQWEESYAHVKSSIENLHVPDEKDTALMIIVQQRGDDYKAYIESDERYWDCDKTKRGAIGDLIRTHPEIFGIAVKYDE